MQKVFNRRWLRFSVRTLLIALTILCVWLGWQTYLARQQRALVLEVQRLGGTVQYLHQFPNGGLVESTEPFAPQWLRNLLGDDFFSTISWVHVDGTSADDQFMRLLKGAPHVRSVGLAKTKVTDKGLAHLRELHELAAVSLGPTATDTSLEILSKLPTLTVIRLDSPNVTNAGIDHLRGMQLKVLWLKNAQIDDAALDVIGTLKNLGDVRLFNTNVTRDGIYELARELPLLQWLFVDPEFTDPNLETVPGTSAKLRPVGPEDL